MEISDNIQKNPNKKKGILKKGKEETDKKANDNLEHKNKEDNQNLDADDMEVDEDNYGSPDEPHHKINDDDLPKDETQEQKITSKDKDKKDKPKSKENPKKEERSKGQSSQRSQKDEKKTNKSNKKNNVQQQSTQKEDKKTQKEDKTKDKEKNPQGRLEEWEEYKDKFIKKANIKITKTVPCSFYVLWILLVLHIIVTYFIKPISTILKIVLITKYNDLKNSELDLYIKDRLNKTLRVFAWLIIFLIPMIHFFTRGISILKIQNGCLRKVYYVIFLLEEIEFQIPLTFLYSENFHSIFLYGEDGVGKLLNPWLIFFPSEYIISFIECFRQFIDSIYFFILFKVHYERKDENKYQKHNLNYLIIGMVNCGIIFVFTCVYFFIRITRKSKKTISGNYKNKLNIKGNNNKGENKKDEQNREGNLETTSQPLHDNES